VGAGLLAMAALRCASQTALSASQASQLPQVIHVPTESAACQDPLWERACSRWHRCGVSARPRCLHRRQASSHRLCIANRILRLARILCGSGLARDGSAAQCIRQTALSASQASQLPQVMHCQRNLRLARILCGSGLARDCSAAVYLPDRVVCIAGKPAPTGNALPAEICALPESLVGAGLPAMAALRCISQCALSASQASQLPQVMHGQQNSRLARIPCGSGLARDGSAAVHQPVRVVCIAGKPAPTGDAWPAEFAACQNPLWERACPR
jgi:hypothetical protein